MVKEKTYRVYKYLIIILFPAVLILGNLQVLMFNEKFYYYLYGKSETYSNFDSVDIVRIQTKNLLGYLRGKNKLDHNFYSEQDSFHLRDVKSLMDFSSRFFVLSTSACFLLGISLIFRRKSKHLMKALLVSCSITSIFLILLSFGILSAFDWLFINFHLVLFSNNLWLFDQSDNLIKLFPRQFFINFANQLALNIFISSAIIAVISFLSLRGAKRRSNLKQFNNFQPKADPPMEETI